MFTNEWKANHYVTINCKTDCNPTQKKTRINEEKVRIFCYHVDNANVVDANAFEIEITKQFKRLGSTRISISKTMTDINVTIFDKHTAVKYVHVERVRIRGRNNV
jgi:hypothetical protein